MDSLQKKSDVEVEISRNKAEHAVHFYAAGKRWINCNTKNA